MITRDNAREISDKGRARVRWMYRQSKTFPSRYLASPEYRTAILTEFEERLLEQEQRILARFEESDNRLFDAGLRGDGWNPTLKQEYDLEVQR